MIKQDSIYLNEFFQEFEGRSIQDLKFYFDSYIKYLEKKYIGFIFIRNEDNDYIYEIICDREATLEEEIQDAHHDAWFENRKRDKAKLNNTPEVKLLRELAEKYDIQLCHKTGKQSPIL